MRKVHVCTKVYVRPLFHKEPNGLTTYYYMYRIPGKPFKSLVIKHVMFASFLKSKIYYRAVLFTFSHYEEKFSSYKKFQVSLDTDGL